VGRSPPLGAPPEPPELPPLVLVDSGLVDVVWLTGTVTWGAVVGLSELVLGVLGAVVRVTGGVGWLTALVTGDVAWGTLVWGAVGRLSELVLGAVVRVTGAVGWLTALAAGALAWVALAWGAVAVLSELVLSELALGAVVWVTGAVGWLTALVTCAVTCGAVVGLSTTSAAADELHVPMPTSAITASAITADTIDLTAVNRVTRNPFGV